MMQNVKHLNQVKMPTWVRFWLVQVATWRLRVAWTPNMSVTQGCVRVILEMFNTPNHWVKHCRLLVAGGLKQSKGFPILNELSFWETPAAPGTLQFEKENARNLLQIRWDPIFWGLWIFFTAIMFTCTMWEYTLIFCHFLFRIAKRLQQSYSNYWGKYCVAWKHI
jgi:hypothetical protein